MAGVTNLAEFLDLTDLSKDLSASDCQALCEKAQRYGVAAVCVQPVWVRHCSEYLDTSDVLVATVFNFPNGDLPLPQILPMIDQAISDGANECDIVIPLKQLAFISDMNEYQDRVSDFVDKIRCAFPSTQTTLKCIIATDVLKSQKMIQAATEGVINGGADFVKTCTGQHGGGATIEAIRWMLETIKKQNSAIGLKASGGIKTVAFANEIFNLVQSQHDYPLTPQHFRIGTSSLLDNIIKEKESNE